MAAGLNTENEHFFGLGITTDASPCSSEDREAAFARLVADQWGLQHVTIEAGRAEDLYRYCDTAQPYAWPFAATTKTFARKDRSEKSIRTGNT